MENWERKSGPVRGKDHQRDVEVETDVDERVSDGSKQRKDKITK